LHDVYVIGAYVATIGLIALSLLSPWTLVVFLSLPAAIKLSRAVHAFGAPDIDRMIVVKTARFHASSAHCLSSAS